MTYQKSHQGFALEWRNILIRLGTSIGAKIILPYLLLTLVVGGVGAFVVTNLVTNSLQERFNNQLLDAGRIVAQGMVRFEEERLAVLRAVAGTEGVPESLAVGDREALTALVPQIVANSNSDSVELLDVNGAEVYGWQRRPGSTVAEERSGADFSQLDEVEQALKGLADEFGDKRVLLAQTHNGVMIYTVGPVYLSEGTKREQVGAVMVGTYLRELVVDLTETAVARVTLYNRDGTVISTTLGGGQEDVVENLQEPPEQYLAIIQLLQESPYQYEVVARAENQVLLREIEVLGQRYVLAYGDWRLRGQSFGLFSVALPSNFIVTTAAVGRRWLSLLFSLATAAVFAMGFAIAWRLIRPLNRLVQTAIAVAHGDLQQRTGIQRNDEIGSLAHSFDAMTESLVERNRQLAERNRQLIEQASELEAILNSIADGVVVLDSDGRIITSNPAAQSILAEALDDAHGNSPGELPSALLASGEAGAETSMAPALVTSQQPRRTQVGGRVLSALPAPVTAPGGEELRTVMILRDITREVEAEQLKDGFITSISHELLTPLTAIKGYSDLLIKAADGNLDKNRLGFVQMIGNNTTRLVHHINKIIDISQIQAGTLRLQPERLCFAELIREVIEGWREQMEAKDLSLRVKLLRGHAWVDADGQRLAWAIDNLLNNAYNYTLTGGRIEVRLFKENDHVRLDVVDTGVGVAAADQPYLFSRFFRANNELTFDVRGVGLGLFITRSIIDLHGGRVWADSQLGVGSTFSLVLPLIK